MSSKKKSDSKEIGLVAGLRLADYFLKSDYLHYGYWKPGLEVHAVNMKQAQQAYSEFLYSFIPPGVHTILDVGCGSGRTAHELIEKGYAVDCVTPSEELANFAEQLLGDRATIYRAKFEDMEAPERYDLVLFSESFQYISLADSLSKARNLLNPGGSILICDFFRRPDMPRKGLISGGHNLDKFRQALEEYELQVLREEDITDEVAPTIDLFNTMTMDVIRPTYYDVGQLLKDDHSLISRMLGWVFRKRLEKIERKFFSGNRSGDNFQKYKIYLVSLLQPSKTI